MGNLNVVGSHCGVSIGEDGPSQMALELAANTKGITFIRVSRPATRIMYGNDETFAVGKAKVVRKSDKDVVLVIAAGITMDQAVDAAAQLAEEGVNIRVMDPFTIKPLDKEAVLENARQCGGKIITVEDHYPEGGIGDAVLDVIAEEKDVILRKMCVREVPRSGPPMVLLEKFGIGTNCIVKTVKDFAC